MVRSSRNPNSKRGEFMADSDARIRSIAFKQLPIWACAVSSIFALADAMFVAGRASSADQYSFPAEIFSIFSACLVVILIGSWLVSRGRLLLGGCAVVLATIVEAILWLGMHG